MLLSIITINYNNAIELEKTIRSVVNQTWKEFEYIIIDGGSTDESVEIIKKYEDSVQYSISEKDRGIYHAMNKGIAIAKGEYLFMLNSGDALANNQVLQTIFEENNHQEDILYGNIKWFSKGSSVRVSTFPEQLNFQYFWYKSLGHQAAFIKRSVHQIVGLYDEELKFVSDWKLFVLAVCKYGASYKHLHAVISYCDCGGLTWQPSNFPTIKTERYKILENEFPLFYDDYIELETIKRKLSINGVTEWKNVIKKEVKAIVRYKNKN